ncbi:MAG: hypothetical protein ACF8Q5_02165 [Phycisphaerales bacterium JB040]
MPFLHRLRLRVFAVLVGVVIASIAALSVFALPAVPVVSVALITAAAVLNSMTAKLGVAVCSGCGNSLEGVPTGAYGAVCPGCGAVNGNTLGGEGGTRLVVDDGAGEPEGEPHGSGRA